MKRDVEKQKMNKTWRRDMKNKQKGISKMKDEWKKYREMEMIEKK